MDQLLDRIFELWRSRQPIPPLSIGIVRPNLPDLYRNHQANELTLFQLASISKLLSSTALAYFSPDGSVYNQSLFNSSTYTKSKYVNQNALIVDSLCHRIGLDDMEPNSITQVQLELDIPREKILKNIAYLPFGHSFRQQFNYNNFLYSYGIQAAFQHLKMDDRQAIVNFLHSLQMYRTYTTFDSFYQDTNRCLSSRLLDNRYQNIYLRNLDADFSAGGISSCTYDMTKFIHYFIKTQPTGVMQPEIYVPGPEGGSFNGRGVSIKYTSAGTIYSHNGVLEEGVHTVIKMVPKMSAGIVILSSGYPAIGVGAMADSVLYYINTGDLNRSLEIFIEEVNATQSDIIYPSIRVPVGNYKKIRSGSYRGRYFDIRIKNTARGHMIRVGNTDWVPITEKTGRIYGLTVRTNSGLLRECYLTYHRDKILLYYLELKFLFTKIDEL